MNKKSKFRPELKKLYNDALALYKDGKHEQAVNLFEQITNQAPNIPHSFFQLGTIAWDHEQLKKAYQYFVKASKLLPESSLASLCVFHVLWELEEYESALNELKRFRNTGVKCKDYDDIIAGLIKDKFIDENLSLL